MPPPRQTSDLPTVALDAAAASTDATQTLGTSGAALGPRVPVKVVPEVIAGYRRLRQLGVGGMGEVHLAHHDRLNRKVALKLLRANVADDGDFVGRFLRESKAMAAVSHPNVVAIHDAGEYEGFLFMALEFVDGTDLLKLLKTRGTLDEQTALGIMIGCCKGLEAIAAAGLVHRDIKLANIFLDRANQPKIGDLGLARKIDGADRMTMTGSAWGTPAYMPPEQLKGVSDIDIRADLYALGASLFTCLTGTEPFTGQTSFVITSKILNDPPPDARSLNRTVSPAVAAIIHACLAKERTQRYPDPTVLRADLERARDGLPLLFAQTIAAPVGVPSPLPGAQPRPTPGPRPAGMLGDSVGPRLDPALIKFLAYGTGVGLLGLVVWSLQGGTTVEKKSSLTVPEPGIPVSTATQPSKPWMTAEGQDAYGRWATVTANGATFRLRLVPAGSFRMGSPVSEPGRSPTETPHQVTLTQAFWMCESEVSRSQWAQVVSATQVGDQLPQTGVSWIAADDFTKALNRAYPEMSARLPTEAEWEYACRAGSPEAYASGPTVDPGEWLAMANKGPRVVGGGPRNRFGLSDLHGNVSEWCRDDWDGATPLPSTEEFDPLNRQGSKAVVRGGSWLTPASAGRSAARAAGEPQDPLPDTGMRFVVE